VAGIDTDIIAATTDIGIITKPTILNCDGRRGCAAPHAPKTPGGVILDHSCTP
jgi:hypothetical protein